MLSGLILIRLLDIFVCASYTTMSECYYKDADVHQLFTLSPVQRHHTNKFPVTFREYFKVMNGIHTSKPPVIYLHTPKANYVY